MGKKTAVKLENPIPIPIPIPTMPIPVELPSVIRSIIVSLFFKSFTDDDNNKNEKSFISLSTLNYKIFQTLRFIILTFYVFILRFIPSPSSFFFSFTDSFFSSDKYDDAVKLKLKPHITDTAIGRALSQLLSSINDIPVSSRKYEVVRSLAEKIIDDNHLDALHEVNRVAMSGAFGKTLRQLEVQVSERWDGDGEGEVGDGVGGEYMRVRRRLRKVVRAVGWRVKGGEGSLSGVPAEKLAAELVWMARKMVECDCSDEAIYRWAAASNLGFLALSADQRLQTSLVKLAAFLFKQAKNMGQDEIEESKMKRCRQVKLKMLQSWLPLLCRATNGTDTPALNISERAELERVLESIIEELEQGEQEQVLSLWLHHFTHCSSSEWPNLNTCFARWCTTSRKQLLLLNEI